MSRDAARWIDPESRVTASVVATMGGEAVVLTPWHGATDPLRVPAGQLAEQLGVGVEDLPGVRFEARFDDDKVCEPRRV